jgi:predicted protein tyrosine phosphatase
MNRRLHILFVCGRNQWRSPTAARVYAGDQRIEVRSAGVSARSRHQVTSRDIQWADLVLVMERKQRSWILGAFPELHLPPIESLDIPDQYEFMDAELVALIREGTDSHLAQMFGIGVSGHPKPARFGQLRPGHSGS